MPMRLLDFPIEIVHAIVNELSPSQKSALSQTCSAVWEIVAPLLYTEICIELPGRVKYKGVADDPVIDSLDQLHQARQKTLDLVRFFNVTGFWYDCYDEVESELGGKGLVSPAVQMLNVLITHCVRRLRNIETVVWDCQIAPTDKFITALTRLRTLKTLELRMSTDHTGLPYYYPPVHLDHFRNLEKLKLEDIEAPNLLSDIVTVLHGSPGLKSLNVTLGRGLCGTPLHLFEDRLNGTRPLRLHSLELQGFSGLDTKSIWYAIEPAALRELTLRCPAHANDPPAGFANEDIGNALENNPQIDLARETEGFWKNITDAGVQLSLLATDMVSPALLQYVRKYPRISRLLLIPCGSTVDKHEDYLKRFIDEVLDAVAPHLEVLALYSRDPAVECFVFDVVCLGTVTSKCQQLRELGIELHENDVKTLLPAMRHLPQLEVLHIMPTTENPEAISNHRETATRVIRMLYDDMLVCPLKYLAIDSSDIYEIVQRDKCDGKDVNFVRRSPKDWDTRRNTTVLFSMAVWEW